MEHETSIDITNDSWDVYCSCGWRGNLLLKEDGATEEDASLMAAYHISEVTDG